jgi:hypothetical protein
MDMVKGIFALIATLGIVGLLSMLVALAFDWIASWCSKCRENSILFWGGVIVITLLSLIIALAL